MKLSLYKKFVIFGLISVAILVFQNCGPAKLQTQSDQLSLGYVETGRPSDVSAPNDLNVFPAPSPSSEVIEPVSCAPAPTSNLIVNVKNTGAQGNGVTDDTASIQSAISQVGRSGGKVVVPAGVYMIDAITGLKLDSYMTLELESGAVLQAITNSATTYTVINITDKSNVNIIGGTISGDRKTHTGTAGQWGAGIKINGGANIVIQGTRIQDAWGDGITISKGSIATTSTNISICGVVADNNRRQGLAIVAARGVLVQNSTFQNSNGTAPSAGINLAPENDISNVVIKDSQVMNNQGAGIMIYSGATRLVSDIMVTNNRISNNAGAIQFPFITNSTISNNIISDASSFGIQLYLGANGNNVIGNDITVTGTAAGKALLIDPGNTVADNILR